MAKRFNKRAFRNWLDVLAKVVVKARDNHTCQIRHDSMCAGTLQPGDHNLQWCHIKSRNNNNLRWDLLNAVTGCGACHAWAHANALEFAAWFSEQYPHRYTWLCNPTHQFHRAWKQRDYEHIEFILLDKACDLEVDYLWVPTTRGYRQRFKRRMMERKV